MVISTSYAAEQQRLHSVDAAYGSRGFNWGYLVAGIAQIEKCSSILDYGCGKGTLGKTLRGAGLDVREYDPGIAKKSSLPNPADLVVSVDVMEHVEPECVAAVINSLASLAQRILFVAISTTPAKRWLSDGRNTHLVIKPGDWWRDQFEKSGFVVRRVWITGLDEWVAMFSAPRQKQC